MPARRSMTTKTKALYEPAELISGAMGAFGVRPEVVAGALRLAGVTGPISRSEAAVLIVTFLTTEV